MLLNRYKPENYICEHADDERTMDQSQSIWSLSLGQCRVLVIREKRNKFKSLQKNNRKRSWKLEIPMRHGSLLEFCPGMQEWFSHEVIKPRKKNGELDRLNNDSKYLNRVNVTARVSIT